MRGIRRDRSVDSIGGKVCSIWPAHGPILVYSCLGEESRIAKGFEDRTIESGGQIDLSADTVGERDCQRVSLTGVDANDTVQSITPGGEWD